MIKALLWDIDGTVLNFLASEEYAIRKCFSIFELGECTDEMLSIYSEINKKYWHLLEDGSMTKSEILINRFKEFFLYYGIDTDCAEAFNNEYQVRLGDKIVFNDDSFEIINKLRGSLLQFAVTNGTKAAQDKKLSSSGLKTVFDRIYISENIGYEKPDLRFFKYIFSDNPEIKPYEMLIIGDSLTSDIKGGNNSGIPTCWYNPNNLPLPESYTVDHIVMDLHQIENIIKKHS